MLFDIHAHLDVKEFENKIENVLNKCKIIIVNAGVDYKSDISSIELSRKYPQILPAVGLHPEYIDKFDSEIQQITPLFNQAVAISEVGVDYFWIKDENLRKKQIEAMKIFLEYSEKMKKSIIIHVRGGIHNLFQILPSYHTTFVIHAFEGSIKDANRIIELGGYISVPPILIRDKYRQKIVENIDLDYLVTETDSPFLGPEKGKINEPCNVALTVQKISEIKNISINEVETKIEKNFKKIIPF
ncbi:TatD family deoxyribonuclease [Acidianus sulfidivorans JP7]|uniref:Hydrolase TatD n=1 Tax=Acidianus sulfidivorans JP7 TaxID=619593 RepID=A0A2U9IM35_9CREN|nr:TatD family hydrolase [Acidianus sulfidivorans]AWR97077.1 TatD family deoxyribonuclease [Acidianus sulfidivorans JP7]